MRISKATHATRPGRPPSSTGSQGEAAAQAGDEQLIWTELVPRLVHPTKLAIIEALIAAGHPLSIDDLVPRLPAIDGNAELIRYHTNSMVETGALEVASTQIETAEGPRFHLPLPASR